MFALAKPSDDVLGTLRLGLRSPSLYEYKVLRALSLRIYLCRDASGDRSCSTLVDLFSQPLPPAIQHIFIRVDLGVVWTDVLDDDVAYGPRHESWKMLDSTLNGHPTLPFISVELIWSSEYPWDDGVSGPKPDLERIKEKRVEEMTKKWQGSFSALRERGIFEIKYTHDLL